MDNSTLIYNAVQRVYRNAIVALIRERLTGRLGDSAPASLRELFGKKNKETGRTYWESIKEAAEERRSGGTGELSTPILDEFDLLGVEHFYTVFEKFFLELCSHKQDANKKEQNQARQVLTGWMKQIKNVRDPVAHPVSADINYEDSLQTLYCARKVLDFCGLPDSSSRILALQKRLLGGVAEVDEKILTDLPPEDEVVMHFIGRHPELAALNNWLNNTTSRRWALSGEGGSGKSAIAYAFGRSVSSRSDHGLEAILWISAKRRRFVEGATLLVDRPDFTDKASSIDAILRFFGESMDERDGEDHVLKLLSEFPTLLIVDDIDTVQGEGEDAIQFLMMSIPEHTGSKVLFTSRRQLFGLGNVTTQVHGMSSGDFEDFVKSRCELMGLDTNLVLTVKQPLLEATDGLPLFVEDLLRLAQTGIGVERAIGLWAEKRGAEARKYAIQREYEKLDDDAKHVLLALAIHGHVRHDDLCKALDWRHDRLLGALQQLHKLFLLPIEKSGKAEVLALNNNTRVLVRELLQGSDAFRRTERMLNAAAGRLVTKRTENEEVSRVLRRAGLLAAQYRFEQAEDELLHVSEKFPGRADILARLAWIQKKNRDFAAARMNFKRAHELGCDQTDAYWHWSDMEASIEEWDASSSAAELGLTKFPDDKGLNFRFGYALHRRGRELIHDGLDGTKSCLTAIDVLEKARKLQILVPRNHSLQQQIYRAMCLTFESMDDGKSLSRHFRLWEKDCPQDPYLKDEYERLRLKYPQFLNAK